MECAVNDKRPLQNDELHISIPAPTASSVYSRHSANTCGSSQTRRKQHHLPQYPHAAKSPKTPTGSQAGIRTVRRWKSLFNFMTRKHIPVLILSVIFSVIVGASIPFQAYLMGKVFSNFAQFGAGTLSEDDFKRGLTTYNIYFVLLGAVCWLFSSALFASWTLFGELQARSARERLFNALLERRIEWFDQKRDGLGALTTRTQSLINELQSATAQPLGMAIRDLITTCASIGLAFYESWKLTLVIMSTLPIIAIIVPVISSRIQPNIDFQAAQLSEAAKHVTNAFSEIETVKYYNGQGAEFYRYTHLLEYAAIFYTRQVNWNALQTSILRFVTLGMFVQGFWFGSTLVSNGADTSGTVLTSFWASVMATGALMQVMPQLISLEKGKIAGHQLRTVMAAASEVFTRGNEDRRKPHSCAGDISFSEVYFAYPSQPQQFALRGANLFFAAGDITFVVGKSGSGKSTVGQLLMQFYSPSSGSIRLDATALEKIDPHWLRNNILLVEQQSVLFNTTVEENVSLGKLNYKAVSLEEIKAAAEFSSVLKTVEAMPQGFGTIVGSKGGSLSGGQRQRIALARAKLRDPPVLILDESTSALDYINRTAVMKAIRQWRHGKTTIIITHDISQILPDDFVYVMKDGQAVQEGFQRTLAKVKGSAFQELINVRSKTHDKRQLEHNKPLPILAKTLSEHTLSPSDIGVELCSAVSENSLNWHVDKPSAQPRASKWVPSVFSPQIGTASIRESTQPPMVIAPFWSVLPGRIPTIWDTSPRLDSSPRFSTRDNRQDVSLTLETPLSPMTNASYRFGQSTSNESSYSPLGARFEISRDVTRVNFVQMEPFRGAAEMQGVDAERFSNREDQDLENTVKYPMKSILRTIWPSLTSWQRFILFLGLASSLAYAASTPVFAFIFSKLLATFYDPQDRKARSLRYSLAILAIAFGDAMTIFVALSQLQRLAQIWVNKIRSKALRRVLDQPREFFDREENNVTRMAECLDHHGEEMQHLLGRFVGNILIVIVMVTMAIAWSFVSCWKLTLVLLACTPVLFLVINGLSAIDGAMEKQTVDASEHASSIFAEVFTNIKTVRSLTLEHYFRTRHQNAAAAVLKTGIRKGVYVGVVYGLSQSILLFIIALIFHYGGVLLRSHEFKLNDILQVFTLLLLSIANATMIFASIPQMSASRESAARLLRLADLPRTSHEHIGTTRVPSIGDISFHNVKFRYPTRPDQLVLRGIDLSIPSGSCVALVGASGSGKSTIASLLLNLYTTSNLKSNQSSARPDITFSRRDMRTIHTPTLRNLIAIVSQTPTLFPMSISGNIVYGMRKSDPLNNAANVRAAATAAGMHDFISTLPEGYDTIIGEGGMGLSGGQAQRIAISRALARRPNVLILDEATSALDTESADIVRDSIRKLLAENRIHGRRAMTVIIITHSRNMMRMADRIVMLDQGRVVEEGRYDQLIRRDGEFARLLRGEAWERDTEKVKRRSMILMSRVKGVNNRLSRF